ncbi:hypothetical protein ES288_D05G355300v1 [Gossypium darwinii]|uniref:Uncharacterized protein n=1 Tax=Gossypium darwinii TaxID=34276 RepID=A0A5D2CRU4_GOSDA|nr:hypothetical protein ES288_D05G355300v1 [Gossypium darwinii]
METTVSGRKADEVIKNISESFTNEVKIWTKGMFGYIDWQEKKLMSRIVGIQHALERYPLHFLKDLEQNLKFELELVLEQKESLWFKKSRAQ